MQLKVRERLNILFVSESVSEYFRWLGQLQLAGFDIHHRQIKSETMLHNALLEEQWNFVVCDFLLLKMSSMGVLVRIRQIDRNIPFIFISDSVGEEAAVAALKAGANDFVLRNHLSRLPVIVQRELSEIISRQKQQIDEKKIEKLSLVVQQSADSVFITDANGRIEYVNPEFEKLYGYCFSEVEGRVPSFLKSDKHSSSFYKSIIDQVQAGTSYQGVVVSRHKGGRIFYENKRITPLKDESGKITHFVVNGRDVTQEVKTKETRDQLIAILEATTDIVFICGTSGVLSYANSAGRALLGLGKVDPIPKVHLADIHKGHFSQKLKTDALQTAREHGSWQGEMELTLLTGQTMVVSELLLAHTDRDGNLSFYSLIARDITERKQFEAEISYQSTHDALTGLVNRALLADRVDVAINQALRSNTTVALILLDLDNFKRINDGMGHSVGDQVLKEIATRLKQFVRPSDTVARIGGDEFVMVLGGLNSAQVVTHLLRKIQIEFDSAIRVCEQDLYLSFSVGVTFYPNDGRSFEVLLRNANAAMYGAKRQGNGQFQWYRTDMNSRGQELLGLESDLRKAIGNREFMLVYQPQVDIKSRNMVGVEALLRWKHPTRGLMEPYEFVYLLEDTGLIIQVGEWVLFQACYDYVVSLSNPYFKARHVSVNVSPRQFIDPAFVDIISHVIDECGISPEMLELEITESTVMRDVQTANEILCALSGLGVRLAVDDFGTGYSSLAYLKRFPLNALKIDRTFIRDLPIDQNDIAITEASISLGHKLGLSVIAEGVENQAQLDFLRRCDCDFVQGFYTGKPVPIETLIRSVITVSS